MPVRPVPSRWVRQAPVSAPVSARVSARVSVAMSVAVSVVVSVVVGAALAACSPDQPALTDLPPDVAQARPTISAEEARFVLDARKRGAMVTGATVADDIETGTTVCWALENGGLTLGEIAVDDRDQPLGNEGDQLRTKQLMAAAVDVLCPDYADQIPQLELP